MLLGPMLLDPGAFLVGSHIHPDNLANQWLLPRAVDTVLAGRSPLQTTDYYWPVGDAPMLSGDGTQALLYAPFHVLVGWPASVPRFVGVVLLLNGLGGWFAARSVTRTPAAAWVAAWVCGASPFVAMELSAGRFSQAAIWPLAVFCGVWWRYLARPGPGLATLSALSLAYTSFSYWYYGWFGVLVGALGWLLTLGDRSRSEHIADLKWHGLFAGLFLVVLAPWAGLFFSHWAAVPGSGETTLFPPDSAFRDRLPFLPALRPGDPATTSSMVSVGALGLALWGMVAGRTERRTRGWMLAGAVFLVLGWGPFASGAPYTLLYGLTAATRRFWWPVRHVVVVDLALAVLAARGVDALVDRWGRSWLAGGMATALVAGLFAIQGAPLELERSSLTVPPEGYDRLAELPEGVVVAFPIAPEATGTNDAMLHQLVHDHPMVTGHSPWVARARPPAWDEWLAEQGFLSQLAQVEREGWSGGALDVDETAVRQLQEEGVRWLVVDRTLVPLKLQAMVRSHDVLFDALFGRPVIRTPDLQVWDLHAYSGTTTVDLPAWTWPAGLRPAGPEWPLASRRPRSPMLGTPSGALDRTGP